MDLSVTRPSLSLAGVWLRGERPFADRVSRVALDLLVPTCRRHYPGGPLGSDRSWDGLFQPFPFIPSGSGLPHPIARSASTLVVSRPARRSLRLRPVGLLHRLKRHICLEGSDGFVSSTAAPIATGWSDPVAGWELHPLKINTFPRRTIGLTPMNSEITGQGTQDSGQGLD